MTTWLPIPAALDGRPLAEPSGRINAYNAALEADAPTVVPTRRGERITMEHTLL